MDIQAVSIMQSERQRTVAIIKQLGLSDRDKEDVAAVFVEVQKSINAWLTREAKVPQGRVLTTALQLVHEELIRVQARTMQAGVALDPDPE